MTGGLEEFVERGRRAQAAIDAITGKREPMAYMYQSEDGQVAYLELGWETDGPTPPPVIDFYDDEKDERVPFMITDV